ncbi:MAG: hypothetical protein KAW02_04990 [candidate division Zixibacteria bacterium]|nr:hypothetical protein [candidate division Zixibacteria bacterium]
MQKNLFELRFVHSEDLVFHETCDFKRTQKLAEEIKRDGHLKNPVLVGSIRTENGEKLNHGRGEKLLVLDGVNRVSALKLLNIPDVLIQMVDYEDKRVKLSSWNHLIFGAQKEEIIKKIKDLNLEVSVCPFNWRKEALNHQKTISYFLFRDMNGFVVNNGSVTPEEKVKGLYQLISIYNSRSEICYLDSDNHLLSIFEHFKNSSAINLIPRFDKKEILGLAQKGILLPFGVTRFIVPHRILGLEVSCSVLSAQTPLSEKNLFLKELLTYRIKTKKAKFYQESVTLFNE